jgi:hypothetical protein
LLGAITVAIALFSRLKLGDPWATIIGCTLALETSIYAVRTLIRRVGMDKIDRQMRKLGLSFLLPNP